MTNEPMYSVLPAGPADAEHISLLYRQNCAALHGRYIPLEEWRQCLSEDDPDEQNLLLRQGAAPVAWMRINGLDGVELAWLSMLVVSPAAQRQGVGTFAVRYAEAFVRARGFTRLGIHTTEDNLPARGLYTQCGYTVTEFGGCTTGDGAARKGYTFIKQLD